MMVSLDMDRHEHIQEANTWCSSRQLRNPATLSLKFSVKRFWLLEIFLAG